MATGAVVESGTVVVDGVVSGVVVDVVLVDVLVDASARVNVKVGDHVQGGSTVLAYLQPQAALVGVETASMERAH